MRSETFLYPAALCMLMVLAFKDSARNIENHINRISWGNVSLDWGDLPEGAFNLACIAFFAALVFGAFVIVYRRLSPEKLEIREEMLTIGALLFIAILMTHPLLFVFQTHVPGDNTDSNIYLWNLWWFKETLLGFDDPYHTDLFRHPVGASLIFYTSSPANGLASLPVQLALGLVPAYNFTVLFIFVMSGYGMVLLARHMVGDRDISFIAGLAFAFIPFRFAHLLGHMHIISTQWIPFFLLHLVRGMKEGDRRDFLLSGVFLALTMHTEFTHVLFSAMMGGLLISPKLIDCIRRMKVPASLSVNIGVAVATFLALSSPILYNIAIDYPSFDESGMSAGSARHSTDVAAYFTPPSFHPLLGRYSAEIESKFHGFISEKVVYMGWTVWAVLFAGLALWIKGRGWKSMSSSTAIWAVCLLLFFLFSLGPFLQFFGYEYEYIEVDKGTFRKLGEKNMKLPFYRVLRHIPLLEMMRTPSRFSLGVLFSGIMLFSYGLKSLTGAGIIKKQHLALIAALVLFEYSAIAYPMADVSDIGDYERLAEIPGDVIYNIPQSARDEYYQTVHGKKRVLGGSGRMTVAAKEHIENFDKDLKSSDIMDVAKKYGIDLFVVKRADGVKNEEEVVRLMERVYGSPVYEGERIRVYATDKRG